MYTAVWTLEKLENCCGFYILTSPTVLHGGEQGSASTKHYTQPVQAVWYLLYLTCRLIVSKDASTHALQAMWN